MRIALTELTVKDEIAEYVKVGEGFTYSLEVHLRTTHLMALKFLFY